MDNSGFNNLWESMQNADENRLHENDVPFKTLMNKTKHEVEELSRGNQVSGEDFDHYMMHWWNEAARLTDPGLGDKKYIMDKCKVCDKQFSHGPSRHDESVDEEMSPEEFDDKMNDARAQRRGEDMSNDELLSDEEEEVEIAYETVMDSWTNGQYDQWMNHVRQYGAERFFEEAPVAMDNFMRDDGEKFRELSKMIRMFISKSGADESVEEAKDSLDLTGAEPRKYDDQEEADDDMKKRLGLKKDDEVEVDEGFDKNRNQYAGRDYVMVAGALKGMTDNDAAVQRFVKMFKADNPKFNEQEFIEAVRG